MRYALKYAYDGSLFEGSQRFRRERGTVDGEILHVLYRMGAVPGDDAPSKYFQTASRTDKGVHALGAVCTIKTDFREEELLRALNGNLRGIVFWGKARVKESFRPRHASSRTYVYIFPPGYMGENVRETVEAAELYRGVHDFSLLCRPDATKRTTPVREILFSELRREGEWWLFTVVGRSFLWNQVRKMAQALHLISLGELSAGDLEEMLKGKESGEAVLKKRGVTISLAPPGGLILWDVHYDNVRFEVDRQALEVARRRIISNLHHSHTLSILYGKLLKLSVENHLGREVLHL